MHPASQSNRRGAVKRARARFHISSGYKRETYCGFWRIGIVYRVDNVMAGIVSLGGMPCESAQ